MISADADRLLKVAKENIALAPVVALAYGALTVIFAAFSTDNRIIYLYDYKDFMLNAVYVMAFSIGAALALFPFNYFISRKMFDLEFDAGFTFTYIVVAVSLILVIIASLFAPKVNLLPEALANYWAFAFGLILIPSVVVGYRHFFLKSQLCLIYFMIWTAAADIDAGAPVYVYKDEVCIGECSQVFISRALSNYLIYYREGDNRMSVVPLSDVDSFRFHKGATREIAY